MNDIFNSDFFTASSLTAAINALDFKPGQIGDLGIFEERGIATTTCSIELKDNKLTLVPHTQRGAPAPVFAAGKRRGVEIGAAHLITRASVLGDSVQDVRAFGSNELASFENIVSQDYLVPMRTDLEATLEFHRVGALQGKILDASGAMLIDLFAEFGVVQQTTDFDLGNSAIRLQQKVIAAKRQAEAVLGALRVEKWTALCSPEFMDGVMGHNSVEIFAAGWEAATILRNDVRETVDIAGVEFMEYRGEFNGQRFIPAGEAILVPHVKGLYVTRFAPADYAEAANTEGLPIYSKSHPLPFDRGVMLEAQSNPVNVCAMPHAVIKLTA